MHPIAAILISFAAGIGLSTIILGEWTTPPTARVNAIQRPSADLAIANVVTKMHAGWVHAVHRRSIADRLCAVDHNAFTMDCIDLSQCPVDFQNAFRQTANATHDYAKALGGIPLGELSEDAVSVVGTGGTPVSWAIAGLEFVGQAAKVDEARKLTGEQAESAYRRLQGVAARYGAKV